MRGGSFIVCLLFLIFQSVSNAAYAQKESDRWILEEILKDSAFTGEIVTQSLSELGPIFWPENLNQQDVYTGHDNLIKNKNGLFIAIEGTGRIYQVSMKANELDFTRIDSTVFGGYNYGAFVYSLNDTIYSLGGYGFWSLNGHLRYFKESSSGWEIKPLNRKIPVGYNNKGLYFDPKNYSLYYTVDPQQVDEALKRNPYDENTKAQVFELNLKTRDWKESGTPTAKSMKLNAASMKIATLPWGELFLTGPRAQLKFETTLIDYRNNRIFSLNKPDKSNAVVNLRYGEKAELNKRIITYYHDSVLTILTSNKERLEIPLKKSNFTDTGMSVYVPLRESWSWNSRNIAWFGIISALTVSTLGFVFWKRRKPKVAQSRVETGNNNTFDKMEEDLIKFFLTKPEPSLSVDEVDEILETSKKSKDTQNQKRSAVTRSINSKYMMVTGDHENLINATRLEFDRRMIQYVLDVERFKNIKHLIRIQIGIFD